MKCYLTKKDLINFHPKGSAGLWSGGEDKWQTAGPCIVVVGSNRNQCKKLD